MSRHQLVAIREQRLAAQGGRNAEGRPNWTSTPVNEKRIAAGVPVDRKNLKKALYAAGLPRKFVRYGRAYVPALPEVEKVRVGNVPLPIGPTFGREREAADIAWRLNADSLCLRGIPGIGKSHLARYVGTRLAGQKHRLYPGGVWYLNAHDLTDEGEEKILHPCLTSVLERIAAQGVGRALLIVDGVDGLVASCALLRNLHPQESHLRILYLARTRFLDVPHYSLRKLRDAPLDADLSETDLAQHFKHAPALCLYVEQVRRWLPTFGVTPQTAHQISHECAACHGVPARLVARAEVAVSALLRRADSAGLPAGEYVRRDAEEQAILNHLAQHRAQPKPSLGLLLSVEGDGGMGKTRLVRAVWSRLAPGNGELRAWVDFTQAMVAEAVEADEAALYQSFLRHLTSAFPLLPSRDPAETLLAYFQDKPGVVVLDNLETVQCRLVEGFLIRLREACPSLCVICTTRFSLAGVTPTLIDLNGGMTLDEATWLFLRRWREAGSLAGQFQTIDQADVRAIVAASERIPLAIELIASAGRMDTPPAELAAELRDLRTESASSPVFLRRFADPASAAARRWSSVQASIRWSYRRLRRWAGAEDGAAVEHALAVCGAFAGPFVEEDFAAIAGAAAVRHLETLRAIHLIDRDPETGAWHQHVFLHEFARELFTALTDASTLRDRFADYFWEKFRADAKDLAQRPRVAARIESAEPNWTQAGYDLLRRAAAGDEAAAELFRDSRADLEMYIWFGRWLPLPFLKDAAERCRSYGDQIAEAHCIANLAISLNQRGRFAEATLLWQKAADRYEAVGDRVRWADAVRVLASIDQEQGRLDEARIGYERAIHLLANESSTCAIYCHRDLASIAASQGRLDEAEAGYAAAMSAFAHHKLLHNVADCLTGLAGVSERRGEFLPERKLLRRALRIYRMVEDASGIHGTFLRLADSNTRTAEMAVTKGCYPRARREARRTVARLETARAMNQQFGHPLIDESIAAHQERIDAVLERLAITA